MRPARKPPSPVSRLAQDLAWRAEAVVYDLFTFLMRAMPVDWASGFGGLVARLFGPLTPIQKVVETNLALAFPDLGSDERRRLIRAQWDNVGRTFAEFPIIDRLTPESGRVEVIGGERLDRLREAGRPVVFVSGHFANWEIMPATIVRHRVPCQMTYRAANNPYVDRRIRDSRARYGVRLFAPKGSDGARELLDGMKAGDSVALMNDQKFNRGLETPFFGHTVMTAPGPSRLALRFGAVLQPMSVQRLKGAHFRVLVHDPIAPAATGDRAGDLQATTERVSAFVEARVREHPADWFWVHRRWPKSLYRGVPAAAGEADG